MWLGDTSTICKQTFNELTTSNPDTGTHTHTHTRLTFSLGVLTHIKSNEISLIEHVTKRTSSGQRTQCALRVSKKTKRVIMLGKYVWCVHIVDGKWNYAEICIMRFVCLLDVSIKDWMGIWIIVWMDHYDLQRYVKYYWYVWLQNVYIKEDVSTFVFCVLIKKGIQ